MHRTLLSLALALTCLSTLTAASTPLTPLNIRDADEKVWTIGAPGPVLVLISSTPSTQKLTREMGAALDEFQGKPNFRALVVVDLRSSLAHVAKGYTVRRMRKDLDQEAERIRPAYLKNGNTSDPRPEIGAVADFDGILCQHLSWSHEPSKLRVTILDSTGSIAAHFDRAEPTKVRDAVASLLSAQKKR